jgi:hypothetical protein
LELSCCAAKKAGRSIPVIKMDQTVTKSSPMVPDSSLVQKGAPCLQKVSILGKEQRPDTSETPETNIERPCFNSHKLHFGGQDLKCQRSIASSCFIIGSACLVLWCSLALSDPLLPDWALRWGKQEASSDLKTLGCRVQTSPIVKYCESVLSCA